MLDGVKAAAGEQMGEGCDPVHLPAALAAIVQETVAAGKAESPLLLFAAEVLEQNLAFFRERLGVAAGQVFFPVKSNNDPGVLSLLDRLGTGFEIASAGELAILKDLGVPGSRILSGNPIKIERHLQAAAGYGVKVFAFDTAGEADKIARLAPGASVYVRLDVANSGAEWELSGKFGADEKAALPLLQRARRLGLQPSGVSFHVGWNNASSTSWRAALARARRVAEEAQAAGMELKFVNLGGGFPAHRTDPYAGLERIATALAGELELVRHDLGLQVLAEPGSFLVANAGVAATQVVDVVERGGERWVFVDLSTANGFYWTLGGLRYEVICTGEQAGLQRPCRVTGATCDSHDLFATDALLPESLAAGDRLLIFPAGAYSNSAREYNGFAYPEVRIL